MGGRKKYIGWVISIFFLGLVFSKIEWKAFLESLGRISVFDIVALCCIYLFGFTLRGVRSRILLPALGYRAALGGVFVGYAANNLLPARLGEVVRAHVVGKYAQIKRTTAFSSILVERIFDGSAIVMLLIVGTSGLQLPEWAVDLRLGGAILFSLALLGVLAVGATHAFWERILPENKVGRALLGLIEGIALAVRDVPTTVMVLVSSVVIWVIEGGMFYYGIHAFGFELSYFAALFVMAVVNLGVLIPSSPGGLGVFQYFTILSLTFLHVEHAPATAYAVVVHLCQYLPVTIIGVLWLPRFGVKTLSGEELEKLKTE